MLPIKNMYAMMAPLNTSIMSRLHLIRAVGIAIITGSVAAVSTMATAPHTNVA
jgi:putative effector of murein hydrolase LrgA (UPF0299 family)